MKFELIAQTLDGVREELNQPEFIGEGINTLDDAISAAEDALEYLNDERLIASFIDIYCESDNSSNGYCGYVDGDGWHRDCDYGLE